MRAKLFPSLLLSSFLAIPLFAQDPQPGQQPQSLADIARQSRKAKEDRAKSGAAPAKTFDEENFHSSGASNLDLAQVMAPDSSTKSKIAEKIADSRRKLAQAESILNTLDPMARPALSAMALQDLNGVEFPGRAAWEDKLFAAKEAYVTRCRAMLRNANALVNEMEALRSGGPVDRSDPRAQSLLRRSMEVATEGQKADAEFEAVMKEGIDLAKRASPR